MLIKDLERLEAIIFLEDKKVHDLQELNPPKSPCAQDYSDLLERFRALAKNIRSERLKRNRK